MFRSFQIIIREFRRSLLKLLHIHDLVRFCKQGVGAAYHVVQESAVESVVGQVCVVCYVVACKQDQDVMYDIYHWCVYSEKLLMMDRGTVRNIQFYSKNKFEKLVHLAGFIIRIYHDARSPERQFVTMYGHLNVNLSRCTVT